MFLKAVCPQCRHRGVKEYAGINYDRPRMPGKGPSVENKRSCPNCRHAWFPGWEKEKSQPADRTLKTRVRRSPVRELQLAVA